MVTAEVIFLSGAVIKMSVILLMLLDKNSTIPRETSIPTTIIWYIYGITYFSISYPLAGIASILGGTLWGLVALYRARSSEQDPNYSLDDIISGD